MDDVLVIGNAEGHRVTARRVEEYFGDFARCELQSGGGDRVEQARISVNESASHIQYMRMEIIVMRHT
jgi:hypothetical protein